MNSKVLRAIAVSVVALATLGLASCDQAEKGSTASQSAGIKDPLIQNALKVFAPLPLKPPVLEGNPASAAKVALGTQLFMDPRLSKSQLISCNTCHNMGLGGADLQKTSTGHGWAQGPRNAPTVFNAAYHLAQFWDGRAKDLEAQAKGPVQAGVEMANTPARVVATLNSMPEYVEAFKTVFAGQKDPVSFGHMAQAIAVFEATLQTPGRFDQFLKGDVAALNTQEKEGLTLFMDTGCAACHSGVAVGGQGYFKFGVFHTPSEAIRPKGDVGRMKVTGKKADLYLFKAPSLRNIALTSPYFHSGQVRSLSKAVDVMADAQLGVKFTATENQAVVAFLKSLTGEQPKVVYPILPASTEETPVPLLD